jgi:type I restriction enzyme S subunit
MSSQSLLDIGSKELQIVQNILDRHVPDSIVWVFGSRATGRAKKFSDLDLCIKGPQPMSLDLASAMAEDFAESDLPWKVDIVDWWSISEGFRQIIERDQVMLQPSQI